MSDCISKEQAIKAMQESEFGYTFEVDVAIEAVKALPTVEPERRKGEWIDGMPYVNSHWKVCSECHVSAPDSCGGFNFCPNCGADMRGENGKA